MPSFQRRMYPALLGCTGIDPGGQEYGDMDSKGLMEMMGNAIVARGPNKKALTNGLNIEMADLVEIGRLRGTDSARIQVAIVLGR
jgi:hypothetical protein